MPGAAYDTPDAGYAESESTRGLAERGDAPACFVVRILEIPDDAPIACVYKCQPVRFTGPETTGAEVGTEDDGPMVYATAIGGVRPKVDPASLYAAITAGGRLVLLNY